MSPSTSEWHPTLSRLCAKWSCWPWLWLVLHPTATIIHVLRYLASKYIARAPGSPGLRCFFEGHTKIPGDPVLALERVTVQ